MPVAGCMTGQHIQVSLYRDSKEFSNRERHFVPYFPDKRQHDLQEEYVLHTQEV